MARSQWNKTKQFPLPGFVMFNINTKLSGKWFRVLSMGCRNSRSNWFYFIRFYQNNVLQIKGCIKIYDNKICIFPDLVNCSTAADKTHPSPMVDIGNISSPCLVI
jgi:hypothetical protein